MQLQCQQKRKRILEFNQYMKSDEMPYIIYADIESLIKNIDGRANNPEDSSTKRMWILNVNCMGF